MKRFYEKKSRRQALLFALETLECIPPDEVTNEEIQRLEVIYTRLYRQLRRPVGSERAQEGARRIALELEQNVPERSIGAWACDAEGRVFFLSESWWKFTGLAKEEGVDAWAQAMHKEDLPLLLSQFNQLSERPRPYTFHCRLRRADGEWVWIYSEASPRWDENGTTFLGYVGHNELADQRELDFREYVGQAPEQVPSGVRRIAMELEQSSKHMTGAPGVFIGNWACDAEGRCTFLSKGWRTFAGFTEEHDLSSWIRCVHPDDLAGLKAEFKEIFPQRKQYSFRYRLRRADDGEYVWVFSQAGPYFDPNGVFLGYSGVVLELVERQMTAA